MSVEKVTIVAEPVARFRETVNQLEVCDAQGRTLGYFLPPDLYHEWLYAWAKAQFADEAELDRARAEPGGMTTAEAISYLDRVARSGGNAA